MTRPNPLIEQLVAEIKTVSCKVASFFLFPNGDGQVCTDSGFKCLWSRLMNSYVNAGGVRFHAHDLRAMYVSLILGGGPNANTHQNEETMKQVYDRRGEIKVTPLG